MHVTEMECKGVNWTGNWLRTVLNGGFL